MANLLIIVAAKAVLFALAAAWLRLRVPEVARILAIGVTIGVPFGLGFFALFYLAVSAIGYHAPVSAGFVAVNAALSYGATAATASLIPLDLRERDAKGPLTRERVYFGATTLAAVIALAATGNAFVKAFSIGVVLMSAAEAAALALGRAGPVASMLHGSFKPLAVLLAASAGLGAFYEACNLAFPVWQWVTLADLPPVARTALMAAIGYIVLIHPLFIAVRLAHPRPPAVMARP